MNVGELRKMLADLPYSTPIVIESRAHEYRSAGATVSLGLKTADARGEWSIDYGEEHTPEVVYGIRQKVLLIECM